MLGQAAGQAGLDHGQAQGALHGMMEHLVAGGEVTQIADAVAARVGISPAQVQAFLPMALSLLQGHAQTTTDPAAQAGLGGILGPLGGLLGGQGGGTGGLGGLLGGVLGGQQGNT
jgi:hypothetical protein